MYILVQEWMAENNKKFKLLKHFASPYLKSLTDVFEVQYTETSPCAKYHFLFIQQKKFWNNPYIWNELIKTGFGDVLVGCRSANDLIV